MISSSCVPVILCGGSGTRLWPLSRKSFPKQFVSLIGAKSLLHLTLERLSRLSENLMCVASEEHRFLVSDHLSATNVRGEIILEPCARNTAPAIALAALRMQALGKEDALLLFCPADHFIPDTEAFLKMIAQGCDLAQQDKIVTFGVLPHFPSAAYGYIQRSDVACGVGWNVERFLEKPNVEKAQELILGGDVFWNAGIFLARTSVILAALRTYAPDILDSCRASMSSAQEELQGECVFVKPDVAHFSTCRLESIDYAVMEQCKNVVVVPFSGAWSDVGSWDAVADLTPVDASGNHVVGEGIAIEARNNFIHAMHRPVVVLGVDDLVVVDTSDAVLVADRKHVEKVKEVVARLERLEHEQAVTHRKVFRPWGWFDSIDRGERFRVKRLMLKPGASISLQKHEHRAEHWVVVSGVAEVRIGEKVVTLTENQSTYIPRGEVHRLSNPGKEPLEIIEVQSGSYVGEDDIVRLEDTYGRKCV